MLALHEGAMETATREFRGCFQPKVSDSDTSWTHVCAHRKSEGNRPVARIDFREVRDPKMQTFWTQEMDFLTSYKENNFLIHLWLNVYLLADQGWCISPPSPCIPPQLKQVHFLTEHVKGLSSRVTSHSNILRNWGASSNEWMYIRKYREV